MLAATRVFAKSWVAAVLIGLLIVSFAVFGIHDMFKTPMGDSVVKAGSRTITSQEYRQEFENFRKNAEQQAGQPLSAEAAAEHGLDRRLLEEIASREAFGEMLHKMGLHISDKLVSSQIQKINAFFDPISGRFSKALYEQKLADNGLSPERFEGSIRDDVAQSHLVAAIVNGLRAPRAYSALGGLLQGEQRDVGYFTVEPGSVQQPAPPTDAQLTAFMKENAAQLTRPELRVLSIVRFSPATAPPSTAPIPEADLKKRYDFRKDTLSKPETRTLVQIPAKDAAAAEAAIARLNKGEDPAAIAKSMGVEPVLYTDKPKTAVADRKVADAAFALTEGQVSAPVQGELGLAVIKVTKVTPGRTVSFEEIRPELEAELRREAASEKVYAQSQTYDEAHSGGASLSEAAKKAGAPVVTIGPITKDGRTLQGQQLQLPPQLMTAAFELPAGGESDLQEVGQGEYFAVRVEKITPAAMPPLAEVKGELTRVWMGREMVKRMQARADELAERLKKGESLQAVAAAAGSTVGHAVGLDRATAGQSTALSRDALVKAFGAKSGDVFTAQATHFGLIVAKLEAVRPPPPAAIARMVEDARPQLTLSMFQEIGESARLAARKEVKVRLDPAKARLALGLEPLAEDGKPAKAGEDAKAPEKAQ